VEVPVAINKLTNEELYSLEYVLRKIKDREKSPSALALAMALCEEIQWRARYTLSGIKEISDQN
jgi:hypothetical protein